MKKTANPNQGSLFDLLRDLRPRGIEITEFSVDVLVRTTIAKAIKDSNLSRVQIAAKMTELLDIEITKTMLDSWTAESREGLNRFPAAYLPVFCDIVGSIEPLRVLADLVGCVVVQGEDALLIELSKIESQKQKLAEKERAIRTILSGAKK